MQKNEESVLLTGAYCC